VKSSIFASASEKCFGSVTAIEVVSVGRIGNNAMNCLPVRYSKSEFGKGIDYPVFFMRFESVILHFLFLFTGF